VPSLAPPTLLRTPELALVIAHGRLGPVLHYPLAMRARRELGVIKSA
jgi:hypothetical protein